jgi:peptide-methionine (S)-S-oxide reductase
VVYDPAITSYGELVDLFWASHDASRRAWSRQYMSAIFVADESQKRIAIDTRARVAEQIGRTPFTEVLPLETFYAAEDYHQKYYLRSDRTLMRELAGYSKDAFVASRVAARLNGYVGGEGSREQLEAELPAFGLSEEAANHLRSLVVRSRSGS